MQLSAAYLIHVHKSYYNLCCKCDQLMVSFTIIYKQILCSNEQSDEIRTFYIYKCSNHNSARWRKANLIGSLVVVLWNGLVQPFCLAGRTAQINWGIHRGPHRDTGRIVQHLVRLPKMTFAVRLGTGFLMNFTDQSNEWGAPSYLQAVCILMLLAISFLCVCARALVCACIYN